MKKLVIDPTCGRCIDKSELRRSIKNDIASARETMRCTKGGCGSGTIACRLWNELNRLVNKITSLAGKDGGV